MNAAPATPAGTPASHRRTLAGVARVQGVGLFSAVPVSAVLRPAPAGAGLVFRRVDLPGTPTIPACITRAKPEARRTVLVHEHDPRARVETVEHVLSALAGLGVGDAVIELDGPELPAGDGSALLFIDAIAQAGGVCFAPLQDGIPPAQIIRVKEPIRLTDPRDPQATIDILPLTMTNEVGPGSGFDGGECVLSLRYELDYSPGKAASEGLIPASIPTQAAELIATAEGVAAYAAEIAPARTFCLLEEALAMRAMGLFQHLSEREMLVIGPDGPVQNVYRFENEPARHKLLDLLGDLSLAARPVHARVIARRSGHALNQETARVLAGL